MGIIEWVIRNYYIAYKKVKELYALPWDTSSPIPQRQERKVKQEGKMPGVLVSSPAHHWEVMWTDQKKMQMQKRERAERKVAPEETPASCGMRG
jgi:hypothetical protein